LRAGKAGYLEEGGSMCRRGRVAFGLSRYCSLLLDCGGSMCRRGRVAFGH